VGVGVRLGSRSKQLEEEGREGGKEKGLFCGGAFSLSLLAAFLVSVWTCFLGGREGGRGVRERRKAGNVRAFIFLMLFDFSLSSFLPSWVVSAMRGVSEGGREGGGWDDNSSRSWEG